jgi:hypothetical protein
VNAKSSLLSFGYAKFGGEQFRFGDEQELERGLSIVARDIRNGYALHFYPSSHEAGFHAITVQIVPQSLI